MIFAFPLLLGISAVLAISDLGTHCFMGPLRLVLDVLLFTFCTLRCGFESLWLISTLGSTPFSSDSPEVITVLIFWDLDFKIPDYGFNRLWWTGSDLFRILIFNVLESEFVIALDLELFGFEVIIALELEASSSYWTTLSFLTPSGTKKVFNPSLIHSQHALRLVLLGFPSENPIPWPFFL